MTESVLLPLLVVYLGGVCVLLEVFREANSRRPLERVWFCVAFCVLWPPMLLAGVVIECRDRFKARR